MPRMIATPSADCPAVRTSSTRTSKFDTSCSTRAAFAGASPEHSQIDDFILELMDSLDAQSR